MCTHYEQTSNSSCTCTLSTSPRSIASAAGVQCRYLFVILVFFCKIVILQPNPPRVDERVVHNSFSLSGAAVSMTYGRTPSSSAVMPNLSSYTPRSLFRVSLLLKSSFLKSRRWENVPLLGTPRSVSGDGRDTQSANNARGARGTSLSSLFILVQIPSLRLSRFFRLRNTRRARWDEAGERLLLYFDFTNSLIPLLGLVLF